MSGGVDSSVAALLLKRQGYDVVGMTAELFGDASAAGPCCGRAGCEGAAGVCAMLGAPHHVVDMTAMFEQQVIDRFIGEYRRGRTPNPCSDCNRFIKFDAFLRLADDLGCAYLATGHYAAIKPGADGAPLLCCAADTAKDQTYFLACIAPAALKRTLFPLGDLTKAQVRAIAAEAGLPTAQRKESQDVCFIANSVGLSELLAWHTGAAPQPGRIVSEDGRLLGEHPGYEHFTIGQRKGLGLGGGTEGLVVHDIHPDSNTVIVAQREAHPVAALVLHDFVDLAPGHWRLGETLEVRGRYRQALWPGRVREIHPPAADGPGTAVVEPLGALYGMAPGQWCVGYRDGIVLFGGVIDAIRYAQ